MTENTMTYSGTDMALAEPSEASFTLAEVGEYADVMVASGFFKDVRDVAQAKVKILVGRSIGLSPIEAMTQINIIQGKIEFSSHLIAQLVQCSRDYDFIVQRSDDKVCTIQFTKGGEPLGEPFSYTMEDARRAGRASSQQYQKFPSRMLFARAMSNGAKMHCPSVFRGVGQVYSEGEIQIEERNITPSNTLSIPPVKAERDSSPLRMPKEPAVVEISPVKAEPASPDSPDAVDSRVDSGPVATEEVVEEFAETGMAKEVICDSLLASIRETAEGLGYSAAKLQAGVKLFSNGRVQSVADMTTDEGQALLSELEKRMGGAS